MANLLPDQLRLMADAVPDEVAYTDVVSGLDLTFAEWEERSNRLARWLVGRGVAKGDRVAVHVPPEEGDRFLVAYSAVHKAGAVAVPTNARMVARELELRPRPRRCGRRPDRRRHRGRRSSQAAASLPDLRTVVTTAASGPTDRTGARSTWSGGTRPREGDGSTFQVPVTGDDMADLMYTSGTTGRPKGVVVRHRQHRPAPERPAGVVGGGLAARLADVDLRRHRLDPQPDEARHAAAVPAPLRRRPLVRRGRGSVGRRRPSSCPAMAELLVASPRFATADLSSITLCPLGSAPLAPSTLALLQERLPGAMVTNSWGMTEAGPAFCTMPLEEQSRRVGSVGKPVPPTELKVVGEDGEELGPDEVGELLVRNPGREREYFADPEATARTWRDGWLHSGDLARVDADGYLYIVGREKDVIIRGGNNVHAADVEAVLYEHPDVQEAAVAGVAHPVLGEDVGAWVVLGAGARAGRARACGRSAPSGSAPRRCPARGPSSTPCPATPPARSSRPTSPAVNAEVAGRQGRGGTGRALGRGARGAGRRGRGPSPRSRPSRCPTGPRRRAPRRGPGWRRGRRR